MIAAAPVSYHSKSSLPFHMIRGPFQKGKLQTTSNSVYIYLMHWIVTGCLSTFLFCSVLVTSCSRTNKNSNLEANNSSNISAENSNAAKTNVEELGLLVTIPYEAEDIVWKEDAAHKKITAVLRFSPEDANKITADATARRAPQNVTLSTPSWFPAELIAQSEMTGDDVLHGTSYAADAFYQEPYSAGRIVRVEGTDYFVLELTSDQK